MRHAALALVMLALSACPLRTPGVDMSTLTDATASARVHQAAARRARMTGTVKAKLPGLQGVIMSADLDVALQPPSMLSVAVRSFFDQPQQILVTDGKVVTLYDATHGAPEFHRGPVDDKAVRKLLPIPLTPAQVVQVFLARPPDDARGTLKSVDEKAGTYAVWFEGEDQAPCLVTARASDDAVVAWRAYAEDGHPVLDVSYGDLRRVGDAVMPFSWQLTVIDTKQALDFVASDVTFNGPALPDDAFHLDPPANLPLLPL